jgi:hypothetical protein
MNERRSLAVAEAHRPDWFVERSGGHAFTLAPRCLRSKRRDGDGRHEARWGETPRTAPAAISVHPFAPDDRRLVKGSLTKIRQNSHSHDANSGDLGPSFARGPFFHGKAACRDCFPQSSAWDSTCSAPWKPPTIRASASRCAPWALTGRLRVGHSRMGPPMTQRVHMAGLEGMQGTTKSSVRRQGQTYHLPLVIGPRSRLPN